MYDHIKRQKKAAGRTVGMDRHAVNFLVTKLKGEVLT
jgi:hypothetical protein